MPKGNPSVRAGPFAGVVDPSDVNASKPTRLFDARNMTIPDPVLGSPAVQRHGFRAQAQQLGSGDARRGQGMHLHRRRDGTLDRFTFAGGRMYAWDGATTYTDITPATILLDARNPVFAKTFDDRVVISDETNRPWVYDPKDGSGTTIKYNSIDDEWNTKGGPQVYSGRIVFIVKHVGLSALTTEDGVDVLTTELDEPLITESLQGFQNTIAWSAALDPMLGYDQDDYDNTWQLVQASAELLTGLAAEEAALVYYRLAGISYITGKIEDDFRTSSTVDAVATEVGQDSPAAILAVDTGGPRKIWFCDVDGRVHRMSPTGTPEELWRPMRRTVERQAGTASCRTNVATFARASYHPSLKLVLFTLWDDQTLYAFDAKSGQYLGTWGIYATPGNAGVSVTAMGSLVDAVNRAVFVAIGSTGAQLGISADLEVTHGTVWVQKFPDDVAPWRDSPLASVSVSPVPFERAIETHWLQHAGSLVFRALTAVATVISDAIAHRIGLAYTVPASGRRATPLVAVSSKVRGGTVDEPAIGSANWGLGPNAQGSAIRLRISGEDGAVPASDLPFGVHEVEVEIQTTKARRNAI